MSSTVTKPKLSDIEVGQVWLMVSPVRLARVVEKTEVEYTTRESQEIMQRPAWKVQITMPSVPIEGFITERNAELTRKVIKNAIPSDESPEPLATTWSEWWSTRPIYPVKKVDGKFLIQDDMAKMVPQSYVHSEAGRDPVNTRTSAAVGHEIVGSLIPPELVPAGLFPGAVVQSPQPAAPVPPATTPVTPPAPRAEAPAPATDDLSAKNVFALRSFAKSKGIDTADIKGPGAKKRIIERIETNAVSV